MISRKELLAIVCTEAVEHGGLQEIPAHKDGARQSYHAAKRLARGPESGVGKRTIIASDTVAYNLRLVKKADGTLEWRD